MVVESGPHAADPLLYASHACCKSEPIASLRTGTITRKSWPRRAQHQVRQT